MSQYVYSPIWLKPESIRLLTLIPDEDQTSSINCRLMDYSLLDVEEHDVHLYEAISYAWGDPTKTFPIYIDGRHLNVTANLHDALLRLRNRYIERIIWVDAVCINQEDLRERGSQIQLMAKIYAKAHQVNVWLGESAHDSSQALQQICLASDTPQNEANHSINQQAILALLQRPWFRRIWVRQTQSLVHSY